MMTIKNQDPEIQLTQARQSYGQGDSALRRGIRAALLGPTSAGRRDQAEKLAAKYCVCHLSPDEMIEKEAASGSQLGQQIVESTRNQKHISDDIYMKVLAHQLDEPACRHGYILDGFPRTIEEAQKVDKVLDEKRRPIDTVIELQKDSSLWFFDRLMTPKNQVGKYYSGRGLHAEIDAGRPFSEVSKKIDSAFANYVKNPHVDLQDATF